MKHYQSRILAYILCTLVLLSGAFLYSKAFAQSSTPNPVVDQAFNSKAATLRMTLNNLLKEHTVLAATTLKSLYKGENTTALQQLMDANQSQLATLVQNGYGTNVRNTFVQLWNAHMQEYKNYTIAEKNHNTAAMNTARQHLATIAGRLGTLLAGDNLSASTITTLMQQHINGTLSFVDEVAKNDPAGEATLMKKGYDQAGIFADSLTRGILFDNLDLFK